MQVKINKKDNFFKLPFLTIHYQWLKNMILADLAYFTHDLDHEAHHNQYVIALVDQYVSLRALLFLA